MAGATAGLDTLQRLLPGGTFMTFTVLGQLTTSSNPNISRKYADCVDSLYNSTICNPRDVCGHEGFALTEALVVVTAVICLVLGWWNASLDARETKALQQDTEQRMKQILQSAKETAQASKQAKETLAQIQQQQQQQQQKDITIDIPKEEEAPAPASRAAPASAPTSAPASAQQQLCNKMSKGKPPSGTAAGDQTGSQKAAEAANPLQGPALDGQDKSPTRACLEKVIRALGGTAIFLVLALFTPPVSTCLLPGVPKTVIAVVPLVVAFFVSGLLVVLDNLLDKVTKVVNKVRKFSRRSCAQQNCGGSANLTRCDWCDSDWHLGCAYPKAADQIPQPPGGWLCAGCNTETQADIGQPAADTTNAAHANAANATNAGDAVTAANGVNTAGTADAGNAANAGDAATATNTAGAAIAVNTVNADKKASTANAANAANAADVGSAATATNAADVVNAVDATNAANAPKPGRQRREVVSQGLHLHATWLQGKFSEGQVRLLPQGQLVVKFTDGQEILFESPEQLQQAATKAGCQFNQHCPTQELWDRFRRKGWLQMPRLAQITTSVQTDNPAAANSMLQPATGVSAAGAATASMPAAGASLAGAPAAGAFTAGAPAAGAAVPREPAAGAAPPGVPAAGGSTAGVPAAAASTPGVPAAGAGTEGRLAAGAATGGVLADGVCEQQTNNTAATNSMVEKAQNDQANKQSQHKPAAVVLPDTGNMSPSVLGPPLVPATPAQSMEQPAELQLQEPGTTAAAAAAAAAAVAVVAPPGPNRPAPSVHGQDSHASSGPTLQSLDQQSL